MDGEFGILNEKIHTEAMDQSGAIELYRSALGRNKKNNEIRYKLIKMLLENGHFLEANDLLSAGLAAAPYDLHLLSAQRILGLALYRANFWEDAKPWLEAAVQLEPWDKFAANVLARVRRPAYIDEWITDPQSGHRLQRYSAREGHSYIYVIDVAGTCNLRCPSCPVGNSELAGRPRGMMSYDLFARVVDKIVREKPCEAPIINLYNWGEPLLNPALPAMIRLLRERGLRAHISTNLNIKHGISEIINENPDEIKISISGFSKNTYEKTHIKGKFDLVLQNMNFMKAEMDRLNCSTKVWVGHHIYKNNKHEIPMLKGYCKSNGFHYHAIPAFMMPIERVMEYIAGTDGKKNLSFIENLPNNLSQIPVIAAATRSGKSDCELRFNQTVINHDGQVALCCTVYDKENMLEANFLNASQKEIDNLKYNHPFCRKCYSKKLEYAPPELSVLRLNQVKGLAS